MIALLNTDPKFRRLHSRIHYGTTVKVNAGLFGDVLITVI